jgi:ABC-2 type transport system permease protein
VRKVLAIARAEYLESVRSKAFLVGVLMMPLMLGGSALVQVLLGDRADLSDRRCAIVDPTGELWPVLQAAVEARNAEAIWETGEDGERVQVRPRFLLERHEPAPDEDVELALSDRARAGELQGFLVISTTASALDGEVGERPLSYHTREPTFTELPRWLRETLDGHIRARRFEAAALDMELVGRLDREVPLGTWGLVSRQSDGSVSQADREHEARTFGIPAAAMFLLFMLVMVSAPQLMNQVLEEKMQRIAEVLVSAVTPFQLMLGKLLAGALVSMTLALLYLGSVWWATRHFGVDHFVPPEIYLWFPLLLVLAFATYGSMFSALGSACSELRDAQSMMMPAMIAVLVPLFAWTVILESPNGPVARALTFFPSATPMVLLLRLAAPPGPPAWETALAAIYSLATAAAFVWASGRIFRIGLLAQGQTPSLRRLAGWILER